MARSMIDRNRDLFGKLLAACPEEFKTADSWKLTRFIQTTAEEKLRLKSAKCVLRLSVAPGFEVFCVNADSADYLAWRGDPPSETLTTNFFDDFSTCAGLCTYLWSEASRPSLTLDPYEIAELIARREGAYTQLEISRFFQETRILKWKEDRLGEFSPERAPYILYSMLGLCDDDTTSVFNGNTRSRLLNVLTLPVGRMFSGQLCLAISTGHWQHAFLELYRCIERLFPLPYLRNLRVKILETDSNFKASVPQLSELVHTELSWRPREIDALSHVLKLCDSTVIKSALQKFEKTEVYTNEVDTLAAAIYDVRNSCAHARRIAVTSGAQLQWEARLDALSEIISELVGTLYVDDFD